MMLLEGHTRENDVSYVFYFDRDFILLFRIAVKYPTRDMVTILRTISWTDRYLRNTTVIS